MWILRVVVWWESTTVFGFFMSIVSHSDIYHIQMEDSPRVPVKSRNKDLDNRLIAIALQQDESSDDFIETSDSDSKAVILKASESQTVGTTYDAEFAVLEELKDLVQHSGRTCSFRVSEKVSECV